MNDLDNNYATEQMLLKLAVSLPINVNVVVVVV